MSTAIVGQAESSQDVLPVCLWEENPYRLVSLWDMLRFRAESFVASFSALGQIVMDIRSGRMPQEASMTATATTLSLLQRECEKLGLQFSAVYISRLRESSLSLDAFRQHAEEAQQRIWDELKTRMYLQIEADKAKYYDPTSPPFGKKIFDQFPSAIDDIVEASNCLALERNTAVVFHLMRVMEAALKVLAKELGIPYAPSWESYLRQIHTVVDSDWKTKTSEQRQKQPFYKEVAGDLQTIKIAWRNPTMHIVKAYDAREAEKIYDCVHSFMIRLSEFGLSE